MVAIHWRFKTYNIASSKILIRQQICQLTLFLCFLVICTVSEHMKTTKLGKRRLATLKKNSYFSLALLDKEWSLGKLLRNSYTVNICNPWNRLQLQIEGGKFSQHRLIFFFCKKIQLPSSIVVNYIKLNLIGNKLGLHKNFMSALFLYHTTNETIGKINDF